MLKKKLYIIRHAKAEDHSFEKKDYDRNIINKGIKRASAIADQLKDYINISDNTAILSSSANRAIQTAELFAEKLGFPKEQIVQTKNIYEAYYKDILQEINKIPDDIDTLLLFGHNPGLSNLTNYICNSYIDLVTSAVAVIELEEQLNFSELSGNTANLIKVISE